MSTPNSTANGATTDPAGAEAAPLAAPLLPGRKRRSRYSMAEKRTILAHAAAAPDLKAWAKANGVPPTRIYAWRRAGLKPASQGVPGFHRLQAAKAALDPRATKALAHVPGRGHRTPTSIRAQHVAAAYAEGTNPFVYARDHGIPPSTLRSWKQNLTHEREREQLRTTVGSRRARSADAELEDLRLENTILKAALKLAARRGFNLLEITEED